MPRGDRTGPLGQGPMTGRAAGYCTGNAVPGFMNPAAGLGMGMAWGRGGGLGRGMAFRRGWGGFGVAPFVPYPASAGGAVAGEEVSAAEADALKAQLAGLQAAVEQISGRLEQIARAPEADKTDDK